MTYSILSLASGNILESYASEDRVLEAAARICESEPAATETLAVITFDDDGSVVEAIDGAELTERLHAFSSDHAASA